MGEFIKKLQHDVIVEHSAIPGFLYFREDGFTYGLTISKEDLAELLKPAEEKKFNYVDHYGDSLKVYRNGRVTKHSHCFSHNFNYIWIMNIS